MHLTAHDDQPRKPSYRCAALARADGSGRSIRSARGLILLHLAACSVWPRRERSLDRQLYAACTVPALLHRSDDILGCGYWLAYRSPKLACADGEACARPLANRLVKAGLIVATILVVAALGFDFVAPLF